MKMKFVLLPKQPVHAVLKVVKHWDAVCSVPGRQMLACVSTFRALLDRRSSAPSLYGAVVLILLLLT